MLQVKIYLQVKENVTHSAFPFYCFLMVKKKPFQEAFSGNPHIREPGNDRNDWGNTYRLGQLCGAGDGMDSYYQA